MIFPSNHTLMFVWYLRALSPKSQDALRPQMDIMCDPECSSEQRTIAYDYLDCWVTIKAIWRQSRDDWILNEKANAVK